MPHLDSLTKEELIELLRRKDKKLEEECARAEDLALRAKAEIKQLRQETEQIKKEAEQIKKNYATFAGGIKKLIALSKITKDYYRKALGEFVLVEGDEIGRSALDALGGFVDKAFDFIDRHGKLLSSFFGVGSESMATVWRK